MTAALNPLAGFAHMWDHPFVRHGLIAGTAVAVAAGIIGYFLVLRSQVFTADALSHVAFTSALIALTTGLDARVGLFTGTIVAALLLGVVGRRGRAEDVVIGSTFVWVLGIGVLTLSIFTTHRSSGNGTASIKVLSGSIYGLDASTARAAVFGAAAVVAIMVAIARPLLFATIDEAVAAARGVPVRVLGYLFLVLVGATAAEAAQAVGALLLLGLLAAPAGAAIRLASAPYRAMATASGIAVGAVWSGLALSYAAPKVPPSFGILSVATGAYLAALAVPAARRQTPSRGRIVHPGDL